DELSGGERCRVALARALVNHPPFVLADEPTADLDEDTECQVFERLIALHRAEGTALVLVTHSLELAGRADRVVQLRAGRVEDADVPRSAASARTSRPPTAPAPIEETMPAAAPGTGLGRFVWRFAGWTTLVVAGLLAANAAVAHVQQLGVTRARAAR